MKEIFHLNAIYYIKEAMYFLQIFFVYIICRKTNLPSQSLDTSFYSHFYFPTPNPVMISQFIRMKRIFSFPSVIMYFELKKGKENIKKNQKMHQGYTIATKTYAKIKK